MLIYRIFNKINNKSYIGQTIHSKFSLRYKGSKWWKYTDNPWLKNAASKYGHANFEISILLDDITQIEQLNEIEKSYIQKFNSLVPNGYNLQVGGKNRVPHKSTKEKLSIANTGKNRKLFRSPDGKIIEIYNLRKFCKEYGLPKWSMYDLIKVLPKDSKRAKNRGNKIRSYKGWTNGKEDIELRSFISPHMEIFTLQNVGRNFKVFCLSHNLCTKRMSEIWFGKRKSYNGWVRNTKPAVDKPDK